MPEYISRETLRDLMYTEAFERDTGLQRWDSGLWIRYKLFENCIEAIPAADVVERPRWIPVTEWLPEDGEDVLCRLLDDNCEVCATVGCYSSTFKLWDLDAEWASSRHVTHWVPLPALS